MSFRAILCLVAVLAVAFGATSVAAEKVVRHKATPENAWVSMLQVSQPAPPQDVVETREAATANPPPQQPPQPPNPFFEMWLHYVAMWNLYAMHGLARGYPVYPFIVLPQ